MLRIVKYSLLCGWMGLAAGAAEPAPTEAELRAAIGKSLALMEQASIGSAEKRTCFTCHNQAVPVITFAEAKKRGFAVNEENFQRQVEHTAAHLKRGQNLYEDGRGQGGRVDTAGWGLWTLEVADIKPNDVTDLVMKFLLEADGRFGHWKSTSERPPTQASHIAATYVALRAMKAFRTDALDEAVGGRLPAVIQWLREFVPKDTEESVYHLRALTIMELEPTLLQSAAAQLVSQQRADGGWGQKPNMASDAYATGTVLTALFESKQVSVSDDAYRRGLRYLLSQQLEDGSWKVATRSRPFQLYYETGFPHGRSQFISISASGWATIALLAAFPETEAHAAADR